MVFRRDHRTALAQLRNTLGKMEVALGAVGDPIVSAGENGKIQWCNAAFDRLVDRPHISNLDSRLQDLLILQGRDGTALSDRQYPVQRTLDAFSPWTDTLYCHRSGRKLALAMTGSRAVTDGKDINVILVIRDVTDHELAERAHAQMIHEQIARLEAEKAVQLRDEFLMVASHELKTPITSIRLQLELFKRHLKNESGPRAWLQKQEKAVETLERQTERLLKLIEGVLDISRITSGRLVLEFEEVDFSALVLDVVQRYREELRQIGSSVEVDVPPGVTGTWDRLRLDQIAVNLLTNAMKYGRGTPIKIELRSGDGAARLSVQDHGIGIAKEDQNKIFQQFVRLHSSDHYGGLGLGLYIVRQIVTALHGTICVESELGKGSKFIVELPRNAVQA